jgi:hypothetical protein
VDGSSGRAATVSFSSHPYCFCFGDRADSMQGALRAFLTINDGALPISSFSSGAVQRSCP